jgi:hypothetical protein
MRTIEIIVAPNGQSRLETKGFQGEACQAASQFLEKALGRTTSEVLTSEFHQSQAQQQHLNEEA